MSSHLFRNIGVGNGGDTIEVALMHLALNCWFLEARMQDPKCECAKLKQIVISYHEECQERVTVGICRMLRPLGKPFQGPVLL